MDSKYTFKGAWPAPDPLERVEVEPSYYRVLVKMAEWRNVYVIADNPIEAKLFTETEDWLGERFWADSETCDTELEEVVSVEWRS